MAFAAYLLENATLVLARGGAFAHFFMLHRGSFGWIARPYPGALAAFPKKKKNEKKEKCPGEGGMGTLGTAWTIIDQAEGQDGWILAKFLFPFLLTESRPIDSHLDQTSLVNKGFIIWPKRQHFLGEQREQSWARLVCQSERRIRFILPAHGYGHIITEH